MFVIFTHSCSFYTFRSLSKCCFASFYNPGDFESPYIGDYVFFGLYEQIVFCSYSPTNLAIKYGCRSVTRLCRNRTIFNTLNRTENLLPCDCSHRPRNSHPYWTSRFFLQVFKWAQRSSVVLGVCLVCLFNLPMEHHLGFSCEMQGYFPRKSFREKTETNIRFALGENALAQSISCLCVSA